MQKIDARGSACPAPVLQTRAALQKDSPARISVTVDNAAAQQNVQRFLESQGYQTELAQKGEDYLVIGSNDPQITDQPQAVPEQHRKNGNIMIMCASDRMGWGDDELGRKLMINFLRTLKEMGPELWRLIFVNNGVKLTVDGSQVIEDLKNLEQSGLKILVCGTCLTHFDLLERKLVGETTNMLDIVTAMQVADKVINL